MNEFEKWPENRYVTNTIDGFQNNGQNPPKYLTA